MCGIIGYTGFQPAIPVILQALKKLEYRGYDSSGLAYLQGSDFISIKAAGKLKALEDKVAKEYSANATYGIGHTRWATHGEPSEANAHPHLDNKGNLAIVHNGIIENFMELRTFLEPYGIQYKSQTDTEVLVNFIAWHKEQENDLEKALQTALSKVRGAYALLIMDKEKPDTLYAIRQAGPLLLGVGTQEYFIASDAPAFLSWTKDVVFLKEGELLKCTPDGFSVKELATLAPVQKEVIALNWDMVSAQKDGYKHFMLKEIFEQPQVVKDCLMGRIAEDKIILPELENMQKPRRIIILACGTSYYAGLWGKEIIEDIAGIAVSVELASEMAFRNTAYLDGDIVLCISQSGETADTLAALHAAKKANIPSLALCNVLGSSLARESDNVLYTQAGPEISVASTKAMMSQLVLLLLVALYYKKDSIDIKPYISELKKVPELLENNLEALSDKARKLAEIYHEEKHFFFLGRGLQYPLAMEGALKLKELSYIHAEGYSSAEMKHGPIALIDSEFPSFILAPEDALFQKVRSNAEAVQARKGRAIVFTQENAKIEASHIWVANMPAMQPFPSFLILPAMQLFAYHIADILGHDVDQPRNLAKSVTVE